MTSVKSCSCSHKWQDKHYGKGRRVHNKMKTDKNGATWRCTVCEKENA